MTLPAVAPLACLLAACLLASCAPSQGSPPASAAVTGTLTYRERSALPEDAVATPPRISRAP